MRRSAILWLLVLGFLGLATPAWAFDYVALDVAHRRDCVFDYAGILYITADDSVLRYDTNAGAFLDPITLGGQLVGIDISPDGQTLAVADGVAQDSTNRILLVDIPTGNATEIDFPLAFAEGGTFMVAWGADGTFLITSDFNGSGWIPLRQYDPVSDTTTVLASVRQDTMLSASADRETIALAESNISSGPVRAYDVMMGGIVASTDTNWFTFEVAISRGGDQLVSPTYSGAFVFAYDGANLTQETVLGQYANYGPIGGAFSPIADVFYSAEFGSQPGVKVYDTTIWQQIDTLDDYHFSWVGNFALNQGRVRVSPDGVWLAVTVDGGVRLYSLQ